MRASFKLPADCGLCIILLLASSLVLAAGTYTSSGSKCRYTGKEDVCPKPSDLQACIKNLSVKKHEGKLKLDITSCFRCKGRKSIKYMVVQPSNGTTCNKVDDVDGTEKKASYVAFNNGSCSGRFCIFVYDKKLRPENVVKSEKEGKCGTSKDACNLCVYTDIQINLPAGSSCGPGGVCTKSSCDGSGKCIQTVKTGQEASKACNDGKKCTVDTCSLSSKTCVNTLKTGTDAASACNDYNSCTTDSCDPATKQCKNVPTVCSDGNECTNDRCDKKKGCFFPTVKDYTPCTLSGSDKCITGVCKSGRCQPGTPKKCDDGNKCTKDSCDSATGKCIFTPIPVPASTACMTYKCEPAKGIVPYPKSGSCDLDNDKCTADTCVNGKCTAGAPKNCDDKNECTTDSCNPSTGLCLNAPKNSGSCDLDNSLCTADTCVAGVCTAGAPKDCDDKNECTTDSCNPSSGCVNTRAENGTTCASDGNGCTDDVCSGGVCTHTPVACSSDNYTCTTETCANNKCSSTPSDAKCATVTPRSSCAATPGTCDPAALTTAKYKDPASGCVFAAKPGCCDSKADCTATQCCCGSTCTDNPQNQTCRTVCNPPPPVCTQDSECGLGLCCCGSDTYKKCLPKSPYSSCADACNPGLEDICSGNVTDGTQCDCTNSCGTSSDYCSTDVESCSSAGNQFGQQDACDAVAQSDVCCCKKSVLSSCKKDSECTGDACCCGSGNKKICVANPNKETCATLCDVGLQQICAKSNSAGEVCQCTADCGKASDFCGADPSNCRSAGNKLGQQTACKAVKQTDVCCCKKTV